MQSSSTILALSLGLIACGGGDGDDPIPPALEADLQAILDDAVANEVTPGVVIHVAAGDDTWSAAAGVSDLDTGAASTPDDRFRAGSIMKTFVATAVLQAVEAGTLELDDVLTDHLPAAVTARIEHAEAIRVDMLLAHRSGIPEWVTDEVHQVIVTDGAHVWPLDEILAQVDPQPAWFAPGEGYAYSNTNYVLLGEILGAVSGRSWRDVIRDQVLAPAGLDDTFLPEPGDVECPAPCAHGYLPFEGAMLDLSRVDPSMAGASGGHALITTAGDLATFLRELRDGALFEEPATLDAMFAFQAAPDPENRQTGYGFGVQEIAADGITAIGHLGGTAGYQSFMLHVPATDRYVTGSINVLGDLAAVLVPVLDRVATP